MHIDRGPITKILEAIFDRIDSAAQRLADRIRGEQPDTPHRFIPKKARSLPILADPIDLVAQRPAPAARQITTGHARPGIVPDRDHIADLETNDGGRLERMDDRDRGKPVKPPEPS